MPTFSWHDSDVYLVYRFSGSSAVLLRVTRGAGLIARVPIDRQVLSDEEL